MAKPQLSKQKNSWIVISSGFPIFFVYFHCAANFFSSATRKTVATLVSRSMQIFGSADNNLNGNRHGQIFCYEYKEINKIFLGDGNSKYKN